MGHSAGAHLCALTTLFLIDEREELFLEANKQRSITQAIKGVIGEITRFNAKENCTLKVPYLPVNTGTNKMNFLDNRTFNPFELLYYFSS